MLMELDIDLLNLYFSPILKDPQELLHRTLLSWMLRILLEKDSKDSIVIKLSNIEFISKRCINYTFNTIKNISNLLNVNVNTIYSRRESLDMSTVSEFSRMAVTDVVVGFEEVADIIISMVNYCDLYKIYGIEELNNILIYGEDAGKRFLEWFRTTQEVLNSNMGTKGLQLKVIHISEILSPFFSETEETLKYLFESSVQDAHEGLLCICLEGLQYFSHKNGSKLDSLQRRLLTTLLLLLDGFDKIIPNNTNQSILIIATADQATLNLEQSLIRPGRLYNIIKV